MFIALALYCQKGDCKDHIYCTAFVDKSHIMGFVSIASSTQEALGTETVKTSLVRAQFHSTTLEAEASFSRLTMFVKHSIANNLLYLVHSNIAGMGMHFPMQDVSTTWRACIWQVEQESMRNAFQTHNMYTTGTVMYEVAQIGEHKCVPPILKIASLSTESVINSCADSTGTVAQVVLGRTGAVHGTLQYTTPSMCNAHQNVLENSQLHFV